MASKFRVVNNAHHDTAQPWHVLFGWAEARSGVAWLKLFWSLIFVIVVCLSTGVGTAILSNIIGFTYPAYITLGITLRVPEPDAAVIKTTDNTALSVSNRWLVYWLIFSIDLIFEQLIGQILRLSSGYYIWKTVFFVWCLAPFDNNGTAFIHAKLMGSNFGKRLSLLTIQPETNGDGDHKLRF